MHAWASIGIDAGGRHCDRAGGARFAHHRTDWGVNGAFGATLAGAIALGVVVHVVHAVKLPVVRLPSQ